MFCCICKIALSDNRQLIRHTNNAHKDKSQFQCCEENCNRSFSVLKSFINHRYVVHSFCKNFNYLEEMPIPMEVEKESLNLIYDESDDSDSDTHFANVDCLDKNAVFVGNSKHEPGVQSKIELYIAKLYAHSDMPRKRVDDIIQNTINLIKDLFASAKVKSEDCCKNYNVNKKCITDIRKIIQDHSAPFEEMETEFKRLEYFRSNSTFIAPESCKLGEIESFKRKFGITRSVMTPIYAQFIPFRIVLQKLFEIPQFYDNVFNYISSLKSQKDVITNFIQRPFWKKKVAEHPNKTILPLFLYFDDYENNNPLGSHRGISKCGAIYVSLPFLPLYWLSKVDSIILIFLFNTLDRKVFKNKIIFSKIIDEFQILKKEGIILNNPDGKKTIHFDLALVLGDNLGVNSILGFVEGFNATYFCRFCLSKRSEIYKVTDEKNCELRSEENYVDLLNVNDVKLSGIVEDCVFNQLVGFHATKHP